MNNNVLPVMGQSGVRLSEQEFVLFRQMIYNLCGINISEHKRSLVENRLARLMKSGNFSSFKDYYEFVQKDKTGNEITNLLDRISTNVTHFFRENDHFEFMKKEVMPWLLSKYVNSPGHKVRVWSTASSSGEEPYTIGMTFLEDDTFMKKLDFAVLGTDISTKVIKMADEGVYSTDKVRNISKRILLKYFDKIKPDTGPENYRVKSLLRSKVLFRRMNLMMKEFPFKNMLDIIFCRNVMIYFDKKTQAELIRKFAKHLNPGGYLMIGHSENLTGVNHDFQYVKPSIYRKI
ncbi:MAG: CheR family methyltransferase [Fibrobacterota bacterium]